MCWALSRGWAETEIVWTGTPALVRGNCLGFSAGCNKGGHWQEWVGGEMRLLELNPSQRGGGAQENGGRGGEGR